MPPVFLPNTDLSLERLNKAYGGCADPHNNACSMQCMCCISPGQNTALAVRHNTKGLGTKEINMTSDE